MTLICQIVQQAFKTTVTIEAEHRLRFLLKPLTRATEDINDFMKLQLAVLSSLVRQHTRTENRNKNRQLNQQVHTNNSSVTISQSLLNWILRYFGVRLA